MRFRDRILAAALFVASLLSSTAVSAQGGKGFDHLTTGFALTGQHRLVRCEDCHVRGIFKGMSAQCAGCHTPGTLVTAVIIPNNHIPVSQPCDTCHTTSTFYGAHFPHSDVAVGTCASCHNGVFAVGKTPTHIPTGASCDVCHTTVSFANAYDAAPIGHIPTAQPCSTCHNPATFVPGIMNHANTAGTCAQCHAASATPFTFTIPGSLAVNGYTVTLTASGQPVTVIPTSQGGLNATNPGPAVNHIPTAASCDKCHTSGIFTAGGFKGGVMHHAAVAGQRCAGCHNNPITFAGTGLGAGGQPFQIPGPVGTPGPSDHIPINGLDCGNSGCHTASDTTTATGSGFATHLTPALSAAGHQGVNLPCESCHTIGMSWKLDSTSLVTPASTHIPPDNTGGTVGCKGCHSATSFGTGGFHLSGTPGTSPVMTVAMHSAVASAVSACATCHEANAGDLTWQGVLGQIYLRPNNGASSGLSQGTDTAHTGTAATADCSSCHSTTPPFSSATSRPAGHIAVVATASCATCHTTGVFNTVVLPMPHSGVVSGTCGSCHGSGLSGSGYLGPFAGPSSLGGSYTPGNVLFVPKQIISSPAIGTSGGHILPPSADDCSVCHLSTSAFGPGTAMVHTNISSGCASCHSNGASWYGVSSTATMLVTTGGRVLSPLHVPVAGATNTACEMCHSTSVFTSFSGTTVNHTSGRFMTYTAGTSATPTCKSCHGPSGATWYGVSLSTATVGSHQGSTSGQDCIHCHTTSGFGGAGGVAVRKGLVARATRGPAIRPAASGPALGSGGRGTANPGIAAAFTHVGVLPGACSGCHSTSGGATARLASHLPTTLSCDACHRTSAWLPAIFVHSGVGAGNCAACHAGNWATAKPANHLLTSRTCDTCHHSTALWTPQAYSHFDTVYTPHPPNVRCIDCHAANTEQVVWKYPNLRRSCAGCHGPQFGARAAVRRSKGPAVPQPQAQP